MNSLRLFSFLLLFLPLFAQETDEEVKKRLENKKVTLDFSETPLKQVLDFMSDVSGVIIKVDEASIAPKKLDEIRVNLTVRDLELISALRLIATLHEFEIQIKDLKVILGKASKSSSVLKVEFFDVVDIIGFSEPKRPAKISEEALTFLITSKCGGNNWEKAGVFIAYHYSTLIVSQENETLEEIRALVRELNSSTASEVQKKLPKEILAIEEKLAKTKITLNFTDTSIGDCFSFLESISGVKLVLSPKIDSSSSITMNVSDLKLRSALNIINQFQDLSFQYKNKSLLIAPNEKIDLEPYLSKIPKNFQSSILLEKMEEMEKAESKSFADKLKETKVTLNFDKTPLDKVIQFLQDVSGANIIVDPSSFETGEVNPKITIRVSDTSFIDALNLVAFLGRLQIEMTAGVIILKKAKNFQIPESQETPEIKALRKRLAREKITLDFSKTPLEDILPFLEAVLGINIVLDPSVDGGALVTLQVNDLEIENMLKLVKELYSIESRLIYNSIFLFKRKK